MIRRLTSTPSVASWSQLSQGGHGQDEIMFLVCLCEPEAWWERPLRLVKARVMQVSQHIDLPPQPTPRHLLSRRAWR
jgi:hypothetical protein